MSLRFRFLIAVNLTLLGVLAVFLVMDFLFQRSTHLAELSVDTRREARLLAQSVHHIERDDRVAMQSLLDRATAALRAEGPTRRDFAALVIDDRIMMPTEGQASAEQFAAWVGGEDTDDRGDHGDWVFGSTSVGDRQVYVFRSAAEVRAISAEHALWRLAEIGLLGLLATGLINLLLIRLVVRPFSALAKTIQRIGKGELGVTTGTFRSQEFQLLANDLNQMSLSLARAEQDRGLQMAKASRLQERLQGDRVEVPGLSVVHWHRAADHVAGDYFDLLHCPDGAWLICIADVTGHGVSAAMGAAILKTLLWSAVESGVDLDRILRSVNQRFSEVTLEEDFASLLLIRWSPESSTLQYASAGHETAYLLCAGSLPQVMESTGTLVGIAHDQVWEIKEILVVPGSQLVMYTDGITEACSPTGEWFGRERLNNLLQGNADRPIQDAIDALVSALERHLEGSPPADDLTLVGLEFAGKPECQTPYLDVTSQEK